MAKQVTDSGTTQSAWNQLDQLLTCAICLDRYRNPKLLPCQHTFCMEPCLEGLIDYIRRQIKCPECRAEHRIPYQGIQGYPTNVTLMRFLELHFEVSGETPDLTPTVRERCGVCSEKAYLATCAHCEKKACPDCKEAHLDILKREITRINSQIRRGLHKLQDALCQSEKSVHNLQQNCTNVTQEIDEVYGRLQKDLKEREDVLKNEVESFMQTELRNLSQLKDNLDVEVANIQSNCELTEKHVGETSEWEDVDLVDYKDTFLKTLEFVRNFDADQAEFNGRLKFQSGAEAETVHQGIANFGELILNCPQFPSNAPNSVSPNLMRSKSDHRLATQFHRQEESRNSYLGVGQRFTGHSSDTESRHDGRSTSPMTGRKLGSDYRRSITERARDLDDGDRFGSKRYSREYGGNWQRDDSSENTGYRSRFARDDLREGSDPDSHSRSVRFARQEQPENTPREKIYDSEDAIRGPLSGLPRLADCPKVMIKLQLNEQKQKQKLEEKNQPPPQQAPAPTPAPQPQPQPVRRTQRQFSEDDEIARIKAQNKSQQSASTQTTATTTSTSTVTTTTTDSSPSRPLSRRVAALQSDGSRPTLQLNRANSQEETTTTTESTGRRKPGSRQEDSGTEVSSSTRGGVKSQSSSTGSRDSPPSRPPSRQVSREEFKTPPSTPTRKLSVEQRSDSSKSETDRTGNDESSVASRKRFFTRNQSDSKFDRPNFNKQSSISGSSKANSSESDSDRQGSVDNTSAHNTTGGDESRFRSANSRTSSNSSLDEAVKSPTTPDSPLFNRSTPTTKTDDPSKVRAQSTESSSGSSSESSSSSSPCRTTVPSVPSKPAPVEEKVDDSRSSRFSSYRTRDPVTPSRTVNDISKVDGRNSPSANRPHTPSGRSSVLDKYQESKEASKPKFVSRFLPRQSSSTTDQKEETSSESESESELAAKEAARDASITALLARSALARRESTGSGLTTSSLSSRSRDDAGTSGASTRSSLYSRDRDDSTSSSLLSRKPTSYLHSRDDKKDTDGAESRYSSLSSSRYLTRGRTTLDDDKDSSKYGSYASRYLSRSKSSAAIGLDRDGSPDDSSRRTGSDRFRKESRFSALRRNKIGRSRSSHDIALHGDDNDDRDIGTTSYRSPRTRDLYGTSSTSSPSSSLSSSTTSSYRPYSSTYKPSYSSYSSRY